MPRAISSALQAHLAGCELTIAICALITRVDTVQLAFTSHDLPLVIGGITYQPSEGLMSSGLRQQTGTSVDNMNMTGLLLSAGVEEVDVLAGKYDEATIDVFICNWADLSMGTMILLNGIMGQIQTSDGNFISEVRGNSQRLKQTLGEVTSPTCRVRQLGDSRCKISLTGYTFTGTVNALYSSTEFGFSGPVASQPDLYFNNGTLTWTSGANNGTVTEIKNAQIFTAGTLDTELQIAPGYTVVIGDTVSMIAGCDRSIATCYTKFNNAINFRGEPWTPGMDAILQIGQ